MNRWSLLSGLLVVTLCSATIFYPPRHGFPGIKSLNEEPARFEGQHIRLGEWSVQSLAEDGFWFGNPTHQVLVKWEGDGVAVGDYLTIKGVSHLKSAGFIEAEFIHIHESFFPLFAGSFVGMLILFHVFRRYWRIDWAKFQVIEVEDA